MLRGSRTELRTPPALEKHSFRPGLPRSLRRLRYPAQGPPSSLARLANARRYRNPASSRLVCRVMDRPLERMAAAVPGVELLRGVSAAELQRLYRESSLFVMPSLVEGFGQVYLEALASGCPVLGTPNTALPDLGGEADGIFLVEPGNIDELTSQFERLSRLLPGEWRNPARRPCLRGQIYRGRTFASGCAGIWRDHHESRRHHLRQLRALPPRAFARDCGHVRPSSPSRSPAAAVPTRGTPPPRRGRLPPRNADRVRHERRR